MDKQDLRERIWDALEASGEARFPFPPHGRIPNFAGADVAAGQLAQTDAWAGANVVKSNPDAPQRPVRRRALEAGKTLYMAVPRLRDEQCFLRLDPAAIEDIDHATTIGGSSEIGTPVHPDQMEPIDCIVSGSVAISNAGDRVGKGEGYSDLEFAILRETGLVDDGTTTASTIHDMQLVDEAIPTGPHDVPIDVIATPEETIQTGEGSKPAGLNWDILEDETITAIPILQELADT